MPTTLTDLQHSQQQLPLSELVAPLKALLQEAKQHRSVALAIEMRKLAHALLIRICVSLADAQLPSASPLPACVLALRVLRSSSTAAEFTPAMLGESAEVVLRTVGCLLHLTGMHPLNDPVPTTDAQSAAGIGAEAENTRGDARWAIGPSLQVALGQVLRVAFNAAAALVEAAPQGLVVAGGQLDDVADDAGGPTGEAPESSQLAAHSVWGGVQRRWGTLLRVVQRDSAAADALANAVAACAAHSAVVRRQLVRPLAGMDAECSGGPQLTVLGALFRAAVNASLVVYEVTETFGRLLQSVLESQGR